MMVLLRLVESIIVVVVFDIVALLVAVDVNVAIDVWVVTVSASVVVERLLTEAFVSVVAVITYKVDMVLIIILAALHLMLSLLQLLL